jgi:hypothetical protein
MQHSLSPMTAEGERRWNGFAPVLCSESDRMEPGRFQGVKTSQFRLFERFRKQPEPEKRFPGCIRYVHSPLRRFA